MSDDFEKKKEAARPYMNDVWRKKMTQQDRDFILDANRVFGEIEVFFAVRSDR